MTKSTSLEIVISSYYSRYQKEIIAIKMKIFAKLCFLAQGKCEFRLTENFEIFGQMEFHKALSQNKDRGPVSRWNILHGEIRLENVKARRSKYLILKPVSILISVAALYQKQKLV